MENVTVTSLNGGTLYQILVRRKDDHATVTTSGITFQVLVSDPNYGLPWPQTFTAPGGNATPVADKKSGS